MFCLPILALIVLIALPMSANSHCDDYGNADDHPDCSDEVARSMTNKVTSISRTPRGAEEVLRCRDDRSICKFDFDCGGPLSRDRCNVRSISGGDPTQTVLLVGLATRLYHSIGINPACANNNAVAFTLDSETADELAELDLLQQILEAAKAGPFGTKFWIQQDQCETVLNGEYSVATKIELIQPK